MDEKIQQILSQAMSPQSVDNTPSPQVSQTSDPVQAIAAAAGVNLDQSQGNNSSDPWENFKQTASQIVSKRGLNDATLRVLLAQAHDESAKGTAAPGNNYFGIKGQGDAGSNSLATQEYGNGGYYGENSGFAAYNSPADSINAYLDLISEYPGVKQAIQTNNPDAIIRAIEANGYATSPTYVQTVESEPEFSGN